ncbi:unnamed protein product [Diatraea saccharalis]|uniref:Uncharacterized protein n=1 Tax=Diatraea saccharalis TaxID=40085 RepID=A0A9N9RGC2_9NEOP|nr:unnamed protein product [Diatraea saccharalis]
MKEINESMFFTLVNQKFEKIKNNQETIVKSQKELQAENVKLKETIGNLNARIDYLEQQARSSNLEIQCVPERKIEDLSNIITQLGKTVIEEYRYPSFHARS